MKNANKAFTLVELLAVIVILGIIAFLIFPNVSKTIEESREKAYARQISILEQAAQKYTKENIDKLSSDKRCISIDTLISSGYIAAKDKDNGKYVVLNPKTDEPLSGGVQVKYDDTYNQYEYTYNSNCNKKITVTLDANGGTLGSSSSTKEVEYYDDYGELPTPTKTGYKFLGWNGKNKFNYETNNYYARANQKKDVDGLGVYERNSSYSSNDIWPIFSTNDIGLEENKTYTISFDIWSNNTTEFKYNVFYVNNNTRSTHNLNNLNQLKQNLNASFNYKSQTGTVFLHIYPKTVFEETIIYISNVQVEQGSKATEYEPYFITPSTVVVQENNHTLTAIWKAE